MKKDCKVETLLYEDLGFPIKLINVPMKKVFGEWILDINLAKLQKNVLHALIYKNGPLRGAELRFIRKYFELTTTAFGKAFGVTHAAVIKWESEQGHIPPTTELCIRLFILDRLRGKNEEFGRLYHKITIESLSEYRKSKQSADPLEFYTDRKRAVA